MKKSGLCGFRSRYFDAFPNYFCRAMRLEESEYCIFHNPDPKKDIQEFRKQFKTQLRKQGRNPQNYFIGYHFPVGCCDLREIMEEPSIDLIIQDACFYETVFEDHAVFKGITFKGSTWFIGAIFKNAATFNEVTFEGQSCFGEEVGPLGPSSKESSSQEETNLWMFQIHHRGAVFEDHVFFDGVCFKGTARFGRVVFKGMAVFGRITIQPELIEEEETVAVVDVEYKGTSFEKEAYFAGTTFESNVWFREVGFGGDAWFQSATFNGIANFDEAVFNRTAEFQRAKFEGEVSFWKSKFANSESEENACRIARQSLEREGDRVAADYYHYREMAAKRRQKPLYIRFPELLFVQLIFGYGIYWGRTLLSWLFIIFGFSIVFWYWNGVNKDNDPSPLTFWQSIYYNTVTFTTLGYGDFVPRSDIFRVLAGVEALIGIFMMAAFVAIFARKYMR